MKQPAEAVKNLISILQDREVIKNESFVLFLLKTCKKQNADNIHKESMD